MRNFNNDRNLGMASALEQNVLLCLAKFLNCQIINLEIGNITRQVLEYKTCLFSLGRSKNLKIILGEKDFLFIVNVK